MSGYIGESSFAEGMEGLGRVSGDKGRQIYHEVIDKVLGLGNGVLNAMGQWGKDPKLSKEKSDEQLVNIVTALYQLVPVAKSYSFYACVKFAALQGDAATVSKVINHPLVKHVLTYLSVVDSETMFLNWNLEIVIMGKFRKKQNLRVTCEISTDNPYAEVIKS